MKKKLLLLALYFLLFFIVLGCNTIPEFSNQDLAKKTFYPASFDFGVGAAVAIDTRKTEDDDASGFLVNIKGYPFGKWYVRPNNDDRIKEYNGAVKESNKEFVGTIEKGKPYYSPDVPKDDLLGQFPNRVSVYYGVSNDNFTGGGLDSAVQSIGLAFDFTPEISLHFGYAIYDVTETNNGVSITDTDGGLLVGVSINLGYTISETMRKVFAQ